MLAPRNTSLTGKRKRLRVADLERAVERWADAMAREDVAEYLVASGEIARIVQEAGEPLIRLKEARNP